MPVGCSRCGLVIGFECFDPELALDVLCVDCELDLEVLETKLTKDPTPYNMGS